MGTGDALPPRLAELVSIAGPGLGCGQPSSALPAAGLTWQLRELLAVVDGFYAFESALHVFPAGAVPDRAERTIDEWNDPDRWRSAYGPMAEGQVFFAEDILGGQFSLVGDAICTFDPETGATEQIAVDLEGWADAVLTDYRVLTGFPLAHDWQAHHGPLPAGQRLVPVVPFVLGGEYAVANLHAVDAVEGMRLRADLAVQLRDLPDGAKVRYRVTGDG